MSSHISKVCYIRGLNINGTQGRMSQLYLVWPVTRRYHKQAQNIKKNSKNRGIFARLGDNLPYGVKRQIIIF